MESDQIPNPVIRRLPKYLVHVQELRDEGVEWASSQDIADALGLTSSTVRQDLSHMDLKGISKKGYEIIQLEAVLRQILGADVMHRMVIVGAGNLGRALAAHGDFGRRGFEICGLFDQDQKILGTKVGELEVKPMSELSRESERKRIAIGVIAVPTAAAQTVADQLVAAKVPAILNLAYKHIQVPEGVTVVDARLMESLQELAYVLGQRDRERRAQLI